MKSKLIWTMGVSNLSTSSVTVAQAAAFETDGRYAIQSSHVTSVLYNGECFWTSPKPLRDCIEEAKQVAQVHYDNLIAEASKSSESEPSVAAIEIVGWQHPESGWVHTDRATVAHHCKKDGPQPVALVRLTDVDGLRLGGGYLSRSDVVDALDCFWNEAVGSAHYHQDATVTAVVEAVAKGINAIVMRLREGDKP